MHNNNYHEFVLLVQVVSKAKEFCEETGNVSSFNDKLIAFLCPSNAYIAGVRSFYNQGEDYAQDDRL